ncbi:MULTISPECIES: hypothetical protein [Paraburkholderia]|uniref:Uncharacterized protein n=1 Tax=Paraburkholderia madseniana TaxID=2599607 RepID=A0AAP5BJR6_9BURK|nr:MULTISPECIES: hypothetical protein [Paraburkholderia]MCX4151049.1 hypothetical protein [Paraburkholderia madseniana]MCX4176689.1 hypothetical protein [Paraburkholderia madseniana]MDN7153981.1 hypothetical protein [Paraburkholderia sp. WS6]MDQ6412863.1 hypothetical protein [Paraburkholderia madseniana]MDQ6464680.1 hypothetical protein [Paraburkholderia madseniana]
MSTSVPAIAVYLVPAIAGAIGLSACFRANVVFALLALPGTVAHELLHWIAGLVSFARPEGLSVIPRRLPDGRYQLGSATFANVRWWNAAIVSLAPLAGYPLACAVAAIRLRNGWAFHPYDLVIWFSLAQLTFASWPSLTDWHLALRSWPMLALGGLLAWWGDWHTLFGAALHPYLQ